MRDLRPRSKQNKEECWDLAFWEEAKAFGKMRIGSLESGTQDPSQIHGPRCLQGKQQKEVGTRVDWIAAAYCHSCHAGRQASCGHLIFQEKLGDWIICEVI